MSCGRHLDLFLLGDLVEDEVLLEGLPRRRDGVLPQLVFPGLNLARGESGLLHFEDRAPQGVFDLPPNELFGQVPGGALGDFFRDLLADRLPLLEGDAAAQALADLVSQLFFRFDADPGQAAPW